jgi:hypothetical protein
MPAAAAERSGTEIDAERLPVCGLLRPELAGCGVGAELVPPEQPVASDAMEINAIDASRERREESRCMGNLRLLKDKPIMRVLESPATNEFAFTVSVRPNRVKIRRSSFRRACALLVGVRTLLSP